MAKKEEKKNEKKEIVLGDYRIHEKDTGSSQVQIALWTKRILYLTEHFLTHKKDHNSRRGLLRLVSRRRKRLDYLRLTEPQEYHEVIRKLGLRR